MRIPKQKPQVLWIIALFTLLEIRIVQAQSSSVNSISFQGALTGASGQPLSNGSYNLTFKFYTNANTATALATSNVPNVPVTGGIASSSITVDASWFNGRTRYLGITINNGQELSPRIMVTAVPYALRSETFSGAVADSQLSENIPRLNGDAVFTGALRFNNTSNVFSGAFAGSGSGITNLNIVANSGGSISPFSFFNSFLVGVGAYPNSVIAEDINRDGKVDLVCLNSFNQTLSVLTNTGNGRFVTASSPSVGNDPLSLIAADVNKDGSMDLICADYRDDSLTVLTNNGTGGFTIASSPTVGRGPYSLTAADVNGDGNPDLISANRADGATLTILTNNGSGGFAIASSSAVGNGPFSVTSADVNGDGSVDLICANYYDNTLTILTNNGTGSFSIASSPGVGLGPHSVTAVDINGDLKIDLICANQNDNTLTVLTNNGRGGFVISSSPDTGKSPAWIIAGDINGDGKFDLVCANFYNETLTVLTNTGDGLFNLHSSPRVGNEPASVTAADVDGDGNLDLICANYAEGTLSVLINTSALTFQGRVAGTEMRISGSRTESEPPFRLDQNGEGFDYGLMITSPNSQHSARIFMENGKLLIGQANRPDAIVVDPDGIAEVRVLRIRGGADVAERLSVQHPDPRHEFQVRPGMVVSIDPTGNRKFKLSDEPYDRKRVGIISGGHGVQPGLVLRDEGNPVADGEQPIALTGQVWCHADATFGPITPGDLLTSSSTPGHAMKVSDDTKARFAVLGQALTGLKEGRGWVQVLVGKQ